MNNIKIKICGMREAENLKAVLLEKPDFVGFIFYEKSSRYVGKSFDLAVRRLLPKSTGAVGVFVNEGLNKLLQTAGHYQLDYLQLHGHESPNYCRQAKDKGYKIIKVFSVGKANFDFKHLEPFLDCCDYFLFDTKGEKRGGNGITFDWNLLQDYPYAKPFFLSGGIGHENVHGVQFLNITKLAAIDVNSKLEISPALKDIHLIKKLKNNMTTSFQVDEKGYYGNFGGAFIPEMLYPNVEELRSRYLEIMEEPGFQAEFQQLLKDYVGRPSPLYKALRLSEKYGAQIYLKREDLNHTGAHKVNNTLGQILLAKRLGKKNIIAETGAGQHGVATATVCALMGMQCIVYMGEIDMARQKPNVGRMRLLGAQVIPALSGSRTLKDATNEAMRHWINNPTDTHYIIGSVVGPHPYPDMVARFQAVISEEMRLQLQEKTGSPNPDYIIACVGGGSNAMGAFYHYLDEPNVKLVAAEAAGHGIDSGESAATTFIGKPGVLHGSKTLLMQTDDGQVVEPYSISAGLDYPGIGPVHAHLHETARAEFHAITDEEAMNAGMELCLLEGIIPAVESAHALAVLEKMTFNKEDVVIINLSGRGDKDLETYLKRLNQGNEQ